MQSVFYVYIYQYPDGVPFYIGKGHGVRAYKHLAVERSSKNFPNKRLVYTIKKIQRETGRDPAISFYVKNVKEDKALFLEEWLVAQIGRLEDGGPLLNLTDGGDGCSGYIFTEEQRRHLSSKNIERWANGGFDEAIKRMSQTKKGMAPSVSFDGRQRQIEAARKWTAENNPMTNNLEARKALSERQTIDNVAKRPEVRVKMSESAKKRGTPKSFDHTGMKDSEETKQKKSESAKLGWMKRHNGKII